MGWLPKLTGVRVELEDDRDGVAEYAWLWAGLLAHRLEWIELLTADLRFARYVQSVCAVESTSLRRVELRHSALVCRILRSDIGPVRVELTPGPSPDPYSTANACEALERLTAIELVLDPSLELP